MDRGFSALWFLIASLVLIAVVAGGGYLAIQQMYPKRSAGFPTSSDVANRDAQTVSQQTSQLQIPDKVSNQITNVEPKPTPSSASQSDSGFTVKKVPAGFVLDSGTEEPTLLIEVTTEPRAEDPATLSLCMTLTDEKDSAVSETDCIPLEKYGTWSVMTNYDLSLAPHPDRMDYWTVGHHPSRIRFELVAGKINDYSGLSVRSRHALLASDNTGTFDFYLHE